MYTINVTEKLQAGHKLTGYDGPCSRWHGHTWKVEVEIYGPSLDELNMLLDFRVIKDTIKAYDHQDLNDVCDVDCPTAEYLAKAIYDSLELICLHLPTSPHIDSVTVWESDNACVTYVK